MTIAQVHTEAAIRPSMTSLTTMPACMKSDQRLTSVVAAANPTCSIDPKSPNPNARRLTGRHEMITQECLAAAAQSPGQASKLFFRLLAVKFGQRKACVAQTPTPRVRHYYG